MKKIIVVLGHLFFLFSSTAGIAFAEIYEWVDKNGVLHASDRPPRAADVVGQVQTMATPQTPSSEVTNNPNQDPGPRTLPAEAVSKKEVLDKDVKVELYITSWCPYCTKARQLLRSLGVPFKEYDIEKDIDAAIRKSKLDSRDGVPFAIINGKKIHGYSQAAYRAALKVK